MHHKGHSGAPVGPEGRRDREQGLEAVPVQCPAAPEIDGESVGPILGDSAKHGNPARVR